VNENFQRAQAAERARVAALVADSRGQLKDQLARAKSDQLNRYQAEKLRAEAKEAAATEHELLMREPVLTSAQRVGHARRAQLLRTEAEQHREAMLRR